MKLFVFSLISIAILLSILPIVGFNVAKAVVEINNPLQYGTFEELIMAILRFLQALALVVTAMVIVVAGYYFVGSAGDPAKVTQARKMITYALIGLLIILVAEGIIQLIQRVIGVQ